MQRIARLSRKNERRVQMLPIHLIDVNPYQPRSEFDDEAVRALASSIASLGLLQPITVRPETNGRYTLIAGERRLRACLRLGMQTIEAMLIDAGDGEAAMLALVENLQREDLHFLDEAAAYARVMRLCGFSQEALASRIGKTQGAIANKLRLLRLDESVREAVKDGRLSAGHARALLPLPAARQREAAETIAAQGLSVRQTEALVKRLTTEKKEREPSIEEITHKLHAHIAEEELAQSLGRGVKIVAGRKKGRIELDYYDMDDLNDLLDALGTLQQRKNGGTKK